VEHLANARSVISVLHPDLIQQLCFVFLQINFAPLLHFRIGTSSRKASRELLFYFLYSFVKRHKWMHPHIHRINPTRRDTFYRLSLLQVILVIKSYLLKLNAAIRVGPQLLHRFHSVIWFATHGNPR
jgi:hypothetical protein